MVASWLVARLPSGEVTGNRLDELGQTFVVHLVIRL